MKEQLIDFETAKLAKEKGFDWKCLGNYHIGRISGKNHVSAIQMYEQDFNNYREPHRGGYEGQKKDQGQLTTSAPTQSLLQKWLREKNDIYIEIEKHNYGFIGYLSGWVGRIQYSDKEGYSSFETYEQALEKGLIESLKLIK